MEEQIVARIDKNTQQQIRVSVRWSSGRPVVNLRIWTRGTDQRRFYPTKAGVALSARHLDALIEALVEARHVASSDTPTGSPSQGRSVP